MTAPPIPFSAGAAWAGRAWTAWRARPLVFAAAALPVLALRWGLDRAGGHAAAEAAILVLSCLADALVFATVWRARAGKGLARGWRELAGRRLKVALAGGWGLAAAAFGALLLAPAASLSGALAADLGAAAAGRLMLGWIFVAGWLCCVLLFAAAFACIAVAHGEDRLWPAGLAGLRAAFLGWRPLLAVWTAFVAGATLYAAAAAAVLGHLGPAALDGRARAALDCGIDWTAPALAVMALLALLAPAATDLLAAAEAGDCCDAVPASFGDATVRRLALVPTALAAAMALGGPFVVESGLGPLLVAAVVLWLSGRTLAAAAPAWDRPDSTWWARWAWLVAVTLPAVLLGRMVADLLQ